jgi:hypothetical protein
MLMLSMLDGMLTRQVETTAEDLGDDNIIDERDHG